MTLVLRHNDKLELNRVEYSGAISLAELIAVAEFQAQEPTWLSYDCLNLVAPGAYFEQVDHRALDALFERYSALFKPLQLVIFRRAAWLCESDEARPQIRHWIGGRDTRAGISSDIREFDSIGEACEWLVLSPAQAEIAARPENFREIVRYTLPARAALAS